MSNAQVYKNQIPDGLETSGSKLVYLYLKVEDEATINELHTALGMKKITLYSLLQTLTATELIDQEGAMYVCKE
jgi:MarR family transcriptional regulator, organic hydroperoxide resistance regulator